MGKLDKENEARILAEMQAAFDAQRNQGALSRFTPERAARMYDAALKTHTGIARDEHTIGVDRPLGQAVPRPIVDEVSPNRILQAMQGGIQPHTDEPDMFTSSGRPFRLHSSPNRRSQRGHDDRGQRSPQNRGGRR